MYIIYMYYDYVCNSPHPHLEAIVNVNRINCINVATRINLC